MVSAPKDPPSDALRELLEQDVAVAVVRTAFALRQALGAALARITPPITPAESGLLHILSLEGGARVGQLAELMTRDRTTVTRLSDKLVGKGLVCRVQDPADRRAVLLQLTPAGDAVLAQVRPLRQALIEKVTAHLDEPAKTDLIRTLMILREQVIHATEDDRCSSAS